MTQKAITIKDLAEKLNISVSTVSRALKDNPEISQQTRKTVQALAKELGYKPNPIAVARRGGASDCEYLFRYRCQKDRGCCR